jgi:type IX secretion system PorP/SprF family membrane protein
MIRRLSILFIIALGHTAAGQHRTGFLQYMYDGMLVNPAYAGSKEALALTGLMKNQWVSIQGAPVTISFSGHAALKNRKLAAGMLFQSERYGIFQSNTLAGSYAYRLKAGNGLLSMGLQAGLSMIQNNASLVRANDVNDPNLFANSELRIQPTAGAGIYFQNARWYAGLASTDLLQKGFNRYYNTVLHGGVLIRCNDRITVKPAALFRYIEGSPLSTNLSVIAYYKDMIGLGAGISPGSGVMLLGDLKLNDQFYFGYGYERNLGMLSVYTGGSHEIMLRYIFKYRVQSVNSRYF